MRFKTIIFDFDGVMSEYTPADRLAEMSRVTGLTSDTIHERLWGSGFESDADRGRYRCETTYLDAFNEQLGFNLTRDDWIACRAAAMRHNAGMHSLVAELKNRYVLAMLTNNGPLAKAAFHRLAPETAAIFGDKMFFSYEFGTKKPDRQIYRRVAAVLDSTPEQCLFVDDKKRNCDGAALSGMTAIMFENITNLQDQLGWLNVTRETG